jgi:hypothetical protein
MSEHLFEGCIFKFSPFNVNSLKILINKELWFGEPENQNDPNEGEFIMEGFNKKLTEKQRIHVLREIFPDTHEDYFSMEHSPRNLNGNELIKKYSDYMRTRLKSEFGICCFSKTYKQILLWSHYANSHEGLCFVFNKKDLIESLANRPWIDHDDIEYKSEIIKVNVEVQNNGNRTLPGYHILRRKQPEFDYEKEYRFISKDPFSKGIETRALKYEANALKAVVFGEKMNVEDKRIVVNIIASSSEFSNVEIWISKKNNYSRENKFELIHDKHPDHYELFKDQGAQPNYVYQGISRN